MHLSHTDAGAGAGRAAYRIHRSLLDLGVDSKMLVGDKRTADESVVGCAKGTLQRLQAKACEYLEAKSARAHVRDESIFFSPSRFSYFSPLNHSYVRQADIVSLYWINGAFIRPEDLQGVAQPIVWRLSDAWPFTGGCHYPAECERFEKQCGVCPQLRNPSASDFSAKLLQRKFIAWQKLNFTVAAPSQWIANLARRSSLFASRRIEVIPTGIDLERYRVHDQKLSRQKLGIPLDRKILAFGALSPNGDVRKGFRELNEALQMLASTPLAKKTLAVVFGSDAPLAPLPIESISLGRLHEDDQLAMTYSAADIVVVPSLEDNLPNVALEAIACGAPVAGFDVCGMPDIIRDQWNGILAQSRDALALGKAIAEFLNVSSEKIAQMRHNARSYAEEKFSSIGQAKAYLALYEQLLSY